MSTTTPTAETHPILEIAPRLSIVGLADLPTPVNLARIEGRDIAIKNDGTSGSLYGGNKVRKLEFLFGDALSRGFESVWTIGAVGSNHVLATSVYARELGLRCRALHFGQPPTDHVTNNLRAVVSQGTRLTLVSRVGLPAAIAAAWLDASIGAERSYTIPGGGSSSIGALGYVNAGLELARQIEAGEVSAPDVVYVAAGTGGTLAGLAVGLGLAGLSTRVVGVGVTERFVCNHATIHGLIAGMRVALRRAGFAGRWSVAPWSLSWDQLGEAYGVPTAAGGDAIHAADETAGLYLEPTYTAKTFAALLADGRDGAHDGQNVMYWHSLNARPVDALTDDELDTSALPDGYDAWL